jgi:uncharacterized membrane protein YesL
MRQALRLLWSSLGDLYYELFPLALTNFLWFLFSIPQLALVGVILLIAYQGPELLGAYILIGGIAVSLWLLLIPMLFATLLIGAPATAGLYYVVNQLVHGEPSGPRLFFSAFRRFFWRAVRLAASNLVLLLLLLLNIYFYAYMLGGFFIILAVLFGYALLLWLLIQPYLFPMLVELETPVRGILRNAVIFALDNVRLTLSLAVLYALIWALTISPLILLMLPFLGPVLLALIGTKAVLELIEKYRARLAEVEGRPPRRRHE